MVEYTEEVVESRERLKFMKGLNFFLSTPISRLEERLDFLKKNAFDAEVRMANIPYIMELDPDDLNRIRGKIESGGLKVFTHGPFFGLDIASMDRNIYEYTERSLIRGLEITHALGADVMVMHSGFLPFFSRGGRRHWFSNWARRMRPVVEKAYELGVRIALENSWEDRPELLEHLIELVGKDSLYVCIDTGHLNVFSKLSIDNWWNRLGKRVIAMHLHDNDGLSDDHLPPGRGTFNFKRLGELLRDCSELPLLDLEVDPDVAATGRDYLIELWKDIWPVMRLWV